ncbi:MAG: sugar O-acetyltransferase [Clostridia bacterium]
MNDKEKMLSGLLYNSNDEELFNDRLKAKELIYDFNNTYPTKLKERNEILKKLIAKIGTNLFIEQPFRCDLGYNIQIGDNFYANYNCTILDCAKVKIGNNVMFGPNVSIYTATHPIHYELRNKGLEYALSITIEDNVWIGGNVVILPNVSIGKNSVIGAGSIVTSNIAPNSVAVGNPAKIIREITKSDKEYYCKNNKV